MTISHKGFKPRHKTRQRAQKGRFVRHCDFVTILNKVLYEEGDDEKNLVVLKQDTYVEGVKVGRMN